MSWVVDRGELEVWPESLACKNGREAKRDREREGKRGERDGERMVGEVAKRGPLIGGF